MKPKVGDLWYVAGFFDGEGAVMLSRQGKYLRLTVAVSQDTRQVPDLHVKWFGGNVYEYTPKDRPDAVIFQWKANGNEAADFLETMESKLIIKKWQALLAIKAWRNRTNDAIVNPILEELKEFRSAKRRRSAQRKK